MSDVILVYMQVEIDAEEGRISVYNNGDGVPVEIHKEEGVYVPEMIFGHLLTSSNYNDAEKKTTGGRNGYGAKLANIFSTEFTIETADGKRLRRYKQVDFLLIFRTNQPSHLLIGLVLQLILANDAAGFKYIVVEFSL